MHINESITDKPVLYDKILNYFKENELTTVNRSAEKDVMTTAEVAYQLALALRDKTSSISDKELNDVNYIIDMVEHTLKQWIDKHPKLYRMDLPCSLNLFNPSLGVHPMVAKAHFVDCVSFDATRGIEYDQIVLKLVQFYEKLIRDSAEIDKIFIYKSCVLDIEKGSRFNINMSTYYLRTRCAIVNEIPTYDKI